MPTHTATYLYEPDSFIPLAQLTAGFGQTALAATGPDRQPLRCYQTQTAQLYYFQTDHLGTPQDITDTEGRIVWSGQYRAWGQLAQAHNGQGEKAHIHNPFRFQGQYHDPETGLHYNRFRYYDPRIGRFTTQDAIGLMGGDNLYQYAPNPTGWVDPLGLYKGEGQRGLGKYHVFHEHSLKTEEYTMPDKEHFSRANHSVYQRIQQDPGFKRELQTKYPDVIKHVQPMRNGQHRGSSPKGMTWHHGDAPGSLQLVDRNDHRDYHKIYHPDGTGGRNKWGGGTKCRKC